MSTKKTGKNTANHLLRDAREARGWSQQELADQIGAPRPFMVSRWESGLTFPSPYYRKKLCDLFGKCAQELGLVRSDLETSSPSLSSQSSLVRQDTSSVYLAVPTPTLVATEPLVGRQQEWAQLQEVWQAAVAGRAHMVLLSGEAGIGKTRLAEELLAWVGRQGTTTAVARCYLAEGELAYAPVVTWLRAEALRMTLAGLADVWLTEVARFVPDLLTEKPDLPPPSPLTERWQRQRLFEALARAILVARQPLLLLLDDLQWCDHETLEWLSYLLRFDPHARLLIVGTMRLEEVAPDHPVASWLLALRCGGLVTESTLGPLDTADTATLARHVAGKALTSTVAAALYRDTEGNPLFVVESVRAGALGQGGMVSQFEGLVPPPHVLPLPPMVQAVIAARLAQLSLHAREVVSLAAVIGRAFTFTLLAQASGSDEDVLVRGLDELWQRRIVREQGGDAYDFSHDKLREATYTALSQARRRLLHRRVFEALQATAAPAAPLAHHARHAGLIEQTFRYSLAAGDDAMRLFAVRDAISHYEQAQQVVTAQAADGHDQHRTLPVVQIHHLYVQLGRAYELNSDYQKAHRVYEAMLTFARKEHEPRMECAALNRLATLASWAFDMRTAATLLREALTVAERSGDTVGLAETEWGLAQVSYYASDAKEALLHGECALALARERDLKELIAHSLNVLAHIYELLGNWEEVAARASEARAFYAALGNRAMETDCLSALTRAQVMSGHPQEGIGTARIAHAISVETENTWGQMYSACQLALALAESGAYTEALSVSQQSVTLARTIGYYPLHLIYCLCDLGLVQITMLTLEAARMTLLEAVRLNERIGESPRSRMFSDTLAATLCMCCALMGEWTEAHAYALQAQAVRDYQLLYAWHFTLWYETEALVRGGDIERAEDAVQRFGACVGEGGGENRRYRLVFLCAQAVLTQWRGETDQAIAHLQEALRLSEELGLPSEQWQIEAALGELYQARGDECQAHEAFARAAKVVQALANALQDEHVQKMFLSATRVRRVLEAQRA
jgi:predicted ATPase